MATHTQDDGFREIQLNGKQLVFVFMAATVVSVVIFLCGVLVGRGVRGERDAVAAAAEQPVVDGAPDLAATPRPPTVVQPGEDPTKAPPPAPPTGDAERGGEIVKPAAAQTESAAPPAAAKTEAPPPVAEPAKSPTASLKPDAKSADAAAKPRTPSVPAAPAREAARDRGVASAAAAVAKSEPVKKEAPKADAGATAIPAVDDPKRGWVIQVAAVKTRDEAEGLAKELGAKGYSAFVLSGASNVFRVRVGGYKSKRDAETVAAKLRKEERINPWVTR